MSVTKLPFSVYCNQCPHRTQFWERIAAFNVESAAKWYAQECAKTNPQFGYRVTHNGRNLAEWNNKDQE